MAFSSSSAALRYAAAQASRAVRSDGVDNAVSCHIGLLMLPDPDRDPSCGDQSLVSVAIPVLVGCDLRQPVPAVGAVRAPTVLGAAVPEAAVDEDGHLGAGKDDVGLPSEVRQRASMDPVAKATPVELSAERQLRPGVASGEGAHLLVDRLAGGEWRAPALRHLRCYRTT